uniref:Uncharacterized protein n=1 Tax=Strongyloides venezuelensis TaxID=75913 RepID=A0A0K0FU00_STRVS
MLFCLFQIALHIFITFTVSLISCVKDKKDGESPAEIRRQIVLARAEELNDRDTLKRTLKNELANIKNEIKSQRMINKDEIYDNAGFTPFPTPVTTPLPGELEAIEHERIKMKSAHEESPQVFKV